ncbi:MAG: hypothetical protein HY907_12995 [Deltaproteobacteria bacterium]|nr:hypothetical protein [Deltaproteobacteria bacterium]
MSTPEERTVPPEAGNKSVAVPPSEHGVRPAAVVPARDRGGRRGRDGADRRAVEPASPVAEPKRSWGEKHGGTIVICLTFGILVLVVVAKNACG